MIFKEGMKLQCVKMVYGDGIYRYYSNKLGEVVTFERYNKYDGEVFYIFEDDWARLIADYELAEEKDVGEIEWV